jgi:hypothetical protein
MPFQHEFTDKSRYRQQAAIYVVRLSSYERSLGSHHTCDEISQTAIPE